MNLKKNVFESDVWPEASGSALCCCLLACFGCSRLLRRCAGVLAVFALLPGRAALLSPWLGVVACSPFDAAAENDGPHGGRLFKLPGEILVVFLEVGAWFQGFRCGRPVGNSSCLSSPGRASPPSWSCSILESLKVF